MQNNNYPKIFIKSKNDLSKQISHKKFSQLDALNLINDVLKNFDKYWKDTKNSKPEKQKFIRSAKGKPLGVLLDKINSMVLAPHDNTLPDFIFGGIKGTSHVKAAKNLIGNKRQRRLLKLDIYRFFEQIDSDRVASFFYKKCQCSKKASKLLSSICCVPIGPKGSVSTKKTIARGFATSPRLAVWCNLNLFIKLYNLVHKELKGKDPKISIYVDDIGIMASRVSEQKMLKLLNKIKKLLENSDPNQKLTLNEKTEIINHDKHPEILGIELRRNKLSLGKKTKSKLNSTKNNKWASNSIDKRKHLIHYKKYVEGL